MVFYTCSGCGESLKKNKVENHVYTCRCCEYLTCIDCGKDFYGDDYKEHNQCITENQKYSAKGTEFKPNKGDVKQQKWMQNIENAASSNTGLSKKARELMSNLSNYDNIPRKRTKFLNFLKNSFRIYDMKLGEEVWEVFSAGNKKESPESTGLEDSKKGEKEDSDNQKTDVKAPEKENVLGIIASQKEVSKKAKKHKVDKDSDEKPIKKKKKTSKKNSAEADSGEVTKVADTSSNQGPTTPIEASCNPGKKDKKKKRKIQDADVSNLKEPSDKKQKKLSGEVNGENNDGGVSEIIHAGNGVKKSKKKKKAKDGNSADDEKTQNGGVGGNNENKVVAKLVSTDDKSIETDRLMVKKKGKSTNQESEMTQNGGGSNENKVVAKLVPNDDKSIETVGLKMKKKRKSTNLESEMTQNGGSTNTTDAKPVETKDTTKPKKKKKQKNTEDNGMVQTDGDGVIAELVPNDDPISKSKKKKKRKDAEVNGVVAELVPNIDSISKSKKKKKRKDAEVNGVVAELVPNIDSISKSKKKKKRKGAEDNGAAQTDVDSVIAELVPNNDSISKSKKKKKRKKIVQNVESSAVATLV